MDYLNKEKKSNTLELLKKRTNWNQTINPIQETDSLKIPKKGLTHNSLLNKFNNIIDYKNIKLLLAFLTSYGKIRSQNKTKISNKKQRLIANAIKKSRALGLIPFTFQIIE